MTATALKVLPRAERSFVLVFDKNLVRKNSADAVAVELAVMGTFRDEIPDVCICVEVSAEEKEAILKRARQLAPSYSLKEKTLSPREQQVLSAVIAHKTNKEIAKELTISERTVKMHVHNLFVKLQATSRHELVQRSAMK